MSLEKQDQYVGKSAEFFDKQEPRTIGDVRNRPPLMKLLGDVKGKVVLEAGCGAGYVARMLAHKGATVLGCDVSTDMIKRAQAVENEHPMGIMYAQANLTHLPYADHSVDKIVTASAIFHLTQDELGRFFKEAYRVLKPGGSIVNGVLHPYVFTEDSPNRKAEKIWGRYTPVTGAPMDHGSQLFNVEYFDKDMNMFPGRIWNHDIETYTKLMETAGFRMTDTNELRVEKDDLLVPEWGDEIGYPAFLHMRAVKE